MGIWEQKCSTPQKYNNSFKTQFVSGLFPQRINYDISITICITSKRKPDMHTTPNRTRIQNTIYNGMRWSGGYGSALEDGRRGGGEAEKGRLANEIKLVFPNAISAQQMYRQRYNTRRTTRPNKQPQSPPVPHRTIHKHSANSWLVYPETGIWYIQKQK